MSITSTPMFDASKISVGSGEILLLRVGDENFIPTLERFDAVKQELLAALAARGVDNVAVICVPFQCRITQLATR